MKYQIIIVCLTLALACANPSGSMPEAETEIEVRSGNTTSVIDQATCTALCTAYNAAKLINIGVDTTYNAAKDAGCVPVTCAAEKMTIGLAMLVLSMFNLVFKN